MNSDTLKSILKTTNGRFKYTKLNEKIVSDHLSFIFKRNHFMFEAFNRKLVQMIESGFAEKFVTELDSNYAKHQSDDGTSALCFDHLGIGFELWLLFVFTAFGFCLTECMTTIHRFVVNS
jgi:tRNA(His) 5'-end guanylyltransferase